jgi:trimeric autotransporter adhesin
MGQLAAALLAVIAVAQPPGGQGGSALRDPPPSRVQLTSSIGTRPWATTDTPALREALALLAADPGDDAPGAPPLRASDALAASARLRTLLLAPDDGGGRLREFRWGWLTLSKWAAAVGDQPGHVAAATTALALAAAAGDDGTACVATYNLGLAARRSAPPRAAGEQLAEAHALCARAVGAGQPSAPHLARYARLAALEAAEVWGHRLGDAARADALLAAAARFAAPPAGGGDGAGGSAAATAAVTTTMALLKAGVRALAAGRLDEARAACAAAALAAAAGGPAQDGYRLTALENLASILVYDVRASLPVPAVAASAGGAASPIATPAPSLQPPPPPRQPLSRAAITRMVHAAADDGVRAVAAAAAALRGAASAPQSQRALADVLDAATDGVHYVRVLLLAAAGARRDAAWGRLAAWEDAALTAARLCALVLTQHAAVAATVNAESGSSPGAAGVTGALAAACDEAVASWSPYLFLHAGGSTVDLPPGLATVLAAAYARRVAHGSGSACPRAATGDVAAAAAGAAKPPPRRRVAAARARAAASPPLRVGVASYDLRSNAMGYLVEGWVASHSATALPLWVYQLGPLDVGTDAAAHLVACHAADGSGGVTAACSGRDADSLSVLSPPPQARMGAAQQHQQAAQPPLPSPSPSLSAQAPWPSTLSDAYIAHAQRFLIAPPAVRDATIAADMAGLLLPPPQHESAGAGAGLGSRASSRGAATATSAAIAASRLHVVVDMAGHFHGARPGVLACVREAVASAAAAAGARFDCSGSTTTTSSTTDVVVVSHMYPGTTGAGAVDWLLTDAVASPVEAYEGAPPLTAAADPWGQALGWRRPPPRAHPLVARGGINNDDAVDAATSTTVHAVAFASVLLPAFTESLAVLPSSFQLNHFPSPPPAWLAALRRPSAAATAACNASAVLQRSRPLYLLSVNSVDKLDPSALTGWANALRALPHGRLLVLGGSLMGERAEDEDDEAGVADGHGLAAAANATSATTTAAAPRAAGTTPSHRLADEVAARGVHPARLAFLRQLPRDDHLARLAAAGDVVLDPRHYSGHTSTTDALWAGAPVAALPGGAFPSRVSASFLAASGRGLAPVLVAHSAAEGEGALLSLARAPGAAADGTGTAAASGSSWARLRAVRRRLHAAADDAGAHLDGAGRVARVQRAYRAAWEASALGRHLGARAGVAGAAAAAAAADAAAAEAAQLPARRARRPHLVVDPDT